jgi:hypothetical protein
MKEPERKCYRHPGGAIRKENTTAATASQATKSLDEIKECKYLKVKGVVGVLSGVRRTLVVVSLVWSSVVVF